MEVGPSQTASQPSQPPQTRDLRVRGLGFLIFLKILNVLNTKTMVLLRKFNKNKDLDGVQDYEKVWFY